VVKYDGLLRIAILHLPQYFQTSPGSAQPVSLTLEIDISRAESISVALLARTSAYRATSAKRCFSKRPFLAIVAFAQGHTESIDFGRSQAIVQCLPAWLQCIVE